MKRGLLWSWGSLEDEGWEMHGAVLAGAWPCPGIGCPLWWWAAPSVPCLVCFGTRPQGRALGLELPVLSPWQQMPGTLGLGCLELIHQVWGWVGLAASSETDREWKTWQCPARLSLYLCVYSISPAVFEAVGSSVEQMSSTFLSPLSCFIYFPFVLCKPETIF